VYQLFVNVYVIFFVNILTFGLEILNCILCLGKIFYRDELIPYVFYFLTRSFFSRI